MFGLLLHEDQNVGRKREEEGGGVIFFTAHFLRGVVEPHGVIV